MDDDQIKITPQSPDFQTELAKKISDLVPEAMSDGKLDVNKLRELVNGDAETSPERFGLFWPGKARAQAVAQLPTTATLKPAKDESVDWDTTKNIFIEGDNLEVLKALQNSYRRKVKMIYIDPPYNTGKEFIYPDNFQEGLKTYLEYTGQTNEAGENTESKKETGGRKHSNWLNMMYPRLQLAKSLLTKDGIVFISIDDHEMHNLRELCDQIFGTENFIANLIWDTNHSAQAGVFKVYHQYVLIYARDASNISAPDVIDGEDFEAGAQKRESNRHPVSEFTFPAGTRWVADDGTELTGQWGGAEKTSLVRGSMICEDGKLKNEATLAAAWTQKSQMQQYFYGDRANLVDSRGQKIKEFYFNSTGKIKIIKSRGVFTPPTVRKEYGSQNSISNSLAKLFNVDESPFDSPKPVAMIREFTEWFVDDGDVVVDFFSGSGTTGHAIMLQNAKDGKNRSHVQVQLPEPTYTIDENGIEIPAREGKVAYGLGFRNIADVSKERIRLAGKKIRGDYAEEIASREVPLDTGFRVYKLAASNFAEWNEEEATEDIQQAVMDFAQHKKPDATPDDLLTEIMLRSRVSLDAVIEKKDLKNGSWVYVINGGNLIAYVADDQLTVEQASEIADMAPGKFVALDTAFNDNDSLKINIANICKEKHVEFRTI